MKKSAIALLALITISCSITKKHNGIEMNGETSKIETVIKGFSSAGDNNNVEELDSFLDENYRVVMNRLFGNKTVNVLNKKQYLEKIETKVFGGDTRVVTIEKIILNGSTAVAKVIFKGKKATFNSLMILVKNESGVWKLVSDTPVIM